MPLEDYLNIKQIHNTINTYVGYRNSYTLENMCTLLDFLNPLTFLLKISNHKVDEKTYTQRNMLRGEATEVSIRARLD